MYILLFTVSLLVGVIGITKIYVICNNNTLKKNEGKRVNGTKISCKEIIGRPTRYLVEVAYIINHNPYKGKIITTDKNIKKYMNNAPIPLIYVEKNNKVYWAEEKSIESVIIIILLTAISIFAFLLAFLLAFILL